MSKVATRYTVDQFDQYTVFYNDGTTETFPIDPQHWLYQQMITDADQGIEVLFETTPMASPTLDEIKQTAVVRLRDMIQTFLDQFTTKYTREEIAYFSTKKELAIDYLANGPSAKNSEITLEANVLRRLTPELTDAMLCQLIISLATRKKDLLPWSSGIRQIYQSLILQAATAEQIEMIMILAKNELEEKASEPLAV